MSLYPGGASSLGLLPVLMQQVQEMHLFCCRVHASASLTVQLAELCWLFWPCNRCEISHRICVCTYQSAHVLMQNLVNVSCDLI
jgi:hypothetical protein